MYSGPLTYAIRLRRLVAQSQALAREFRSDEVHPEHLFLALLRDPEGVAAAVLAAHSVNVPALGSCLEGSVPTGRESSSNLTVFTNAVYTLFERMAALARELNHAYVGGEHLLLAFMQQDDGQAKRLLEQSGVRRRPGINFTSRVGVAYIAGHDG